MIKNRKFRNFIWLGIFGFAMGIMEAIVVVYLRKIYYPNGFDFPLTNLPMDMLSLELIREMCTLVILAVVAIIAGRNRIQKFAWFIYTFAIWDIFYYIGLKISIGWPASFLTWDILFLIPVPWVAPVLAPVVCSLTMIMMAAVIIIFEEKRNKVCIRLYELGIVILGTLIILISFMKDYLNIIIKEGFLSKYFSLTTDSRFLQIFANYSPDFFEWPLFLFGETLILTAIVWNVFYTNRKVN